MGVNAHISTSFGVKPGSLEYNDNQDIMDGLIHTSQNLRNN